MAQLSDLISLLLNVALFLLPVSSLQPYYELETTVTWEVSSISKKPARSRIHCVLLCELTVSCSVVEFMNSTCSLLKKVQPINQEQVPSMPIDREYFVKRNPSCRACYGKPSVTGCGACANQTSGGDTFCICTNLTVKTGCSSYRNEIGNRFGIFHIRPISHLPPIPVLCDMNDSNPWIVIQRRTTGKLSFYKTWSEYKKGFGSMLGEFWLGNERIHNLTTHDRYELRVDLQRDNNGDISQTHANYNPFLIRDESQLYSLYRGVYSGTAGDSLSDSYHQNRSFMTRDRDTSGHNCPEVSHGAWWYSGCHISNLNGKFYANGACEFGKGMNWFTWFNSRTICATSTMMKIRPVL